MEVHVADSYDGGTGGDGGDSRSYEMRWSHCMFKQVDFALSMSLTDSHKDATKSPPPTGPAKMTSGIINKGLVLEVGEEKGNNGVDLGKCTLNEEPRERREEVGAMHCQVMEMSLGCVSTVAAAKENGRERDSDDGDSDIPCFNARLSLGILLFLGLMVAYLVKVSLSITIVAMVTRNITANATDKSDTCPVNEDNEEIDDYKPGEFDWNENMQSTILGSFFYGYTLTNVLGGRAAEYLGSKLVFGLGIVIPSALSLLSPLCIHTSPNLFIALRILEGLAQGVVFPSVHFMMASWIPPKDRAKYCSFVISGSNFGTVVAMAVGGWLSNSSWGWPSVFYVFGSAGVLWGVFWFLFAHDLPEQHPRISKSELDYILKHRYYVKRDKVISIPWLRIATSVPFWAIVLASFSDNYNFYTLLTEMPTYLSNILHFDISKNGLASALPYAIQCIVSMAWGVLVHILHEKNYLSLVVVRKLSSSVGLYLSAAGLVAMIWVNCNSTVAMVLLCFSVAVTGAINSGSAIGEQDIAPNFAGTLKGLTNTLGSTTGFLAPAVTGAVTNNNQTISAWNTVFLISASLNLIMCTVYVIYGTDKVQPWNYPTNLEQTISEQTTIETTTKKKKNDQKY